MHSANADTIAAIATARGQAGVGIVRISGPKAKAAALALTQCDPTPRYAHYVNFTAQDKQLIDKGLLLFFNGPASFTGEDIVEFHAHGSPIVLDRLLAAIVNCDDDIRVANPGEFTERAFLNNKIDLAQAEAIADLISAQSDRAALCAVNSLSGVFSKKIQALTEQLIALRVYIEAALDFPEEEIDFLADQAVQDRLNAMVNAFDEINVSAKQGVLLQEGMTLAIVGRPNAGKSSLLNYLSGEDVSIVTDQEGTTRNVVREVINIDGMPMTLLDTAGLRETDDVVEQEGIRRTQDIMNKADHVVFVVDATQCCDDWKQAWPAHLGSGIPSEQRLTVVMNKMDLLADRHTSRNEHCVYLSCITGEGIEILTARLKSVMGFEDQSEGQFIARRRHCEALKRAKQAIDAGIAQLNTHNAGELLAEELAQAQRILAQITGEFHSDDLLGEIFSTFCMGK